jgi:hypothetical protein
VPFDISAVPGNAAVSARLALAADDVTVRPQYSSDLEQWSSGAPGFTPLSSTNNGDGTVTFHWQAPSGGASRLYFRLAATLVP